MSRRMGFNKAFIEIDGLSIIERTSRTMAAVFSSPAIIANDTPLYSHLGLPVYPDVIKDAGSLGGIYTALYHSREEYAFVTACDMPWLDQGCVRRVLENVEDEDCVIPFISGRLHPMHAAWSKNCMKELEAAINKGNLRINDLLRRINMKKLGEDIFDGLPIQRSVENVNTTDDLERTGLDEKK